LTPITDRASLDADQERLWATVAGGPRAGTAVREGGQLTGPFDVLLRSPEVGVAVAELGARLRYASSLDPRDTELVILLVAGRHRARYAWLRHVIYAERAGIPGEVPRGRLIVRVVESLLDTAGLDDDLYREAEAQLGIHALVDVVSLAGYYTLSSFLLNTFDVPLPKGSRSPWDAAEPEGGSS
jgi:4-carboxymuconolactone decarboxylase